MKKMFLFRSKHCDSFMKKNCHFHHLSLGSIFFLFTVLCSSFMIHQMWAFPSGAPSDVCESFSPIRGHKVLPQPNAASPFQLIQSKQFYGPDVVIEVELSPYDAINSQGFKGFIIQALDANTLEYIGQFSPGEGIILLPECSAATHSDPRVKNSAFFFWNAPIDRSGGEVIFRATIVVSHQTYWVNVLSELLVF